MSLRDGFASARERMWRAADRVSDADPATAVRIAIPVLLVSGFVGAILGMLLIALTNTAGLGSVGAAEDATLGAETLVSWRPRRDGDGD